MTKEELEKITVEFMNKYNHIEYARIESVMGKELLAYAELFEKRIAELEKENEELKEELKKWKDEWQEQVQKATDEGYARTLQTIQLTKAKDHIKKLLDCLKQDTNDPQTNYYVCQYMDKAEQFIKEIEK